MENKPNKNIALTLYWKCQLIGWAVASCYWFFLALIVSDSFDLTLGIVHFIFDMIVGIGLTHAYRNYEHKRKWHDLDAGKLIWRIIPAVAVLAVFYMLLICLKLVVIDNYFSPLAMPDDVPPEFVSSFFLFVKYNGITVLMTGIRLMAIWVLAYHMYLFARREIKATSENARLILIAKEMQLSNLSTQLNPHFLFNSLNNIKSLVIDQPSSARRAIDLLSDLLRNSLYRTDHLLISLEHELELVNDYLELEKMRFEERLQIEQDIEAGILQQRIPPLTIQTLVENAIKHGIDSKKEGGLILIRIKKETELLQIEVYNSGTLQVKEKEGLGIKNLSERLKLQYEGRAVLSLRQFDQQQVLAMISIPL